ncbi:MAG: DeoR/GlpR transcriptional regulator [Clostridia bacterium]|nr:DeoR/GlpR transcriptional regulator [Clostridia bacterium]
MNKERRKQIQLFLDINGKMTYAELNEKFPDVSSMTIRRDIEELEKHGSVMRVKNGAVSLTEVTKYAEGGVINRANLHIFEKQGIAEKAVSLVGEGQTLFIDGGSTTTFFARELPDKRYKIITNGLNIAQELTGKINPMITIVGGEFSKTNQATCGRRAELFLSSSDIDVAIMATSAYSYSDGFSCAVREEAELKSFVISRAKKRVMLLDSSKLGKSLSYTFAKMENIDVLVVDEYFPQELKQEFKRRGVRII